jgi:isopenicillin N synthase-like dioxygenase
LTTTQSGSFPDQNLPNLRPSINSLTSKASKLAKRLLKSLATDLHTDPDEFLRQHSGMLTGSGNNASSLRLLHYPPLLHDDAQKSGQKITRCGTHTDYGGLTLLFQVT